MEEMVNIQTINQNIQQSGYGFYNSLMTRCTEDCSANSVENTADSGISGLSNIDKPETQTYKFFVNANETATINFVLPKYLSVPTCPSTPSFVSKKKLSPTAVCNEQIKKVKKYHKPLHTFVSHVETEMDGFLETDSNTIAKLKKICINTIIEFNPEDNVYPFKIYTMPPLLKNVNNLQKQNNTKTFSTVQINLLITDLSEGVLENVKIAFSRLIYAGYLTKWLIFKCKMSNVEIETLLKRLKLFSGSKDELLKEITHNTALPLPVRYVSGSGCYHENKYYYINISESFSNPVAEPLMNFSEMKKNVTFANVKHEELFISKISIREGRDIINSMLRNKKIIDFDLKWGFLQIWFNVLYENHDRKIPMKDIVENLEFRRASNFEMSLFSDLIKSKMYVLLERNNMMYYLYFDINKLIQIELPSIAETTTSDENFNLLEYKCVINHYKWGESCINYIEEILAVIKSFSQYSCELGEQEISSENNIQGSKSNISLLTYNLGLVAVNSIIRFQKVEPFSADLVQFVNFNLKMCFDEFNEVDNVSETLSEQFTQTSLAKSEKIFVEVVRTAQKFLPCSLKNFLLVIYSELRKIYRTVETKKVMMEHILPLFNQSCRPSKNSDKDLLAKYNIKNCKVKLTKINMSDYVNIGLKVSNENKDFKNKVIVKQERGNNSQNFIQSDKCFVLEDQSFGAEVLYDEPYEVECRQEFERITEENRSCVLNDFLQEGYRKSPETVEEDIKYYTFYDNLNVTEYTVKSEAVSDVSALNVEVKDTDYNQSIVCVKEEIMLSDIDDDDDDNDDDYDDECRDISDVEVEKPINVGKTKTAGPNKPKESSLKEPKKKSIILNIPLMSNNQSNMNLEGMNKAKRKNKTYNIDLCSESTGLRLKCVYDNCNSNFANYKSYYAHLEKSSNHKTSLHQCLICAKQFQKNEELSEHWAIEHLYKVTTCACEYCPKMFIDVNFLNLHVLKRHKEKLRCQMCDVYFLSWIDVKVHLTTSNCQFSS